MFNAYQWLFYQIADELDNPLLFCLELLEYAMLPSLDLLVSKCLLLSFFYFLKTNDT